MSNTVLMQEKNYSMLDAALRENWDSHLRASLEVRLIVPLHWQTRLRWRMTWELREAAKIKFQGSVRK